MKLILFVWTGFCPDYTDGLAFAVARDETEARQLVREVHKREPYTWGKLHIHKLDDLCLGELIAYAECGGG